MGSVYIFFVILLLVVVANHLNQNRLRDQTWGMMARMHNLHYQRAGAFTPPRVTGVLDAHDIRLTIVKRGGENKTPYTEVTSTTRRPMPAGLAIGREGFFSEVGKVFGRQDIQIGSPSLDTRLNFRGDSEVTIQNMFADPELCDALMALITHTSYSAVRGSKVCLSKRGGVTNGIEPFVREAIALAAALDAARVRPWQALAARHQLMLVDKTNTLLLEGTHLGQPVNIRVNLSNSTVILTVPLSGMPPGLQISAASGKGIQLGDPILDGMITVKGSDEAAIRALLRDDELRGVLLSVVHAWPGSQVTDQQISLCLPDIVPDQIDDRLEEITTLAARLMRNLPGQAAHLHAARQAAQRQNT